MAKPGEIDWGQVKTEYITTGISLRKLAEKYSVTLTVLARHSKAGKWVEERERHTNKCVTRALRNAEEREVNRLSRLMAATDKAIDVAMGAFEDEQQFNRYIISEGIGGGATETTERVYAKVDTKALKDLTAVIKDLTGLMRDFYNLPTPTQAEAQRIAAERLEMDKAKADGDRAADCTVNVVFDKNEWDV